MYSRVPNKRGATFINFRNFVQGVRSYLGVVKYLLRGTFIHFGQKCPGGTIIKGGTFIWNSRVA